MISVTEELCLKTKTNKKIKEGRFLHVVLERHQIQKMWMWLSKLAGACLVAIAILIVFSKRPDLYEHIKIITLLIEQNQSLNT